MDAISDDISLGDHVRVRATPVTVERGLAGRAGQVYGHTTPSVTGVSVIGSTAADLAFSVHFEPDEDVWLSEDLLEFVDHAAGTEIRIGEVAMVRDSSGEWRRIGGAEGSKKRWWKRR